jgi:WD40 repeat protein
MRRVLLSLAAVLLSVGSVFAADPQPLWEPDTTTDKLRSLEVVWLGFSPDGKTLVARVYYVTQKKDQFKSPYIARLLAWDTVTRKEKFNLDFGNIPVMEGCSGTCAITDDERVLVPGRRPTEVTLADGHTDDLYAGPSNCLSIWFDPKSRRTVCYTAFDVGPLWFSVGQLPKHGAKGEGEAEEWTDTRLPGLFFTTALTASQESKQIAVASSADNGLRRPTLRLYTITSKNAIEATATVEDMDAHTGSIRTVQFSPDGKTLALGGGDALVSLWDVTKAGKDWTPHTSIRTGTFTVVCLAFSPDGRTLAAGTTDRKGGANLYMIDVRGGKLVASRKLTESVTALAYSPDGKLLASGHNGGKVQVWDAAAIRGD